MMYKGFPATDGTWSTTRKREIENADRLGNPFLTKG